LTSTANLGFTALGDPTRREIFERVARRPTTVGNLASHFSVSRPAVSQHLRVLKNAGLVRDTAVGTSRIYRLEPRGMEAMRHYLDRFWERALSAFAQAAEAAEAAEAEAAAASPAVAATESQR
jgi:DNA-binding transcriptional ArsR family regulator